MSYSNSPGSRAQILSTVFFYECRRKEATSVQNTTECAQVAVVSERTTAVFCPFHFPASTRSDHHHRKRLSKGQWHRSCLRNRVVGLKSVVFIFHVSMKVIASIEVNRTYVARWHFEKLLRHRTSHLFLCILYLLLRLHLLVLLHLFHLYLLLLHHLLLLLLVLSTSSTSPSPNSSSSSSMQSSSLGF